MKLTIDLGADRVVEITGHEASGAPIYGNGASVTLVVYDGHFQAGITMSPEYADRIGTALMNLAKTLR